jgi:hypothetical protein
LLVLITLFFYALSAVNTHHVLQARTLAVQERLLQIQEENLKKQAEAEAAKANENAAAPVETTKEKKNQ